MIDYQRVVEFLRDFRATPGQPVTDEVRRYATEYAQHCANANERLRQCSVFLQQGLRSEAIHLAEEPPNLLELVAALDLPEPQEWIEFCQQHDLPAPAPLQIERAGRLNDAYGQTQPVENLMKTHRRLALARAPVKQRLETMRQIAAADGGDIWHKDISTFEKARLKEIKVAFASALENHDGTALATLSDEVLSTAWLEEPPGDLLTAARGTDDRIKLLSAAEKLNKLLAELRVSYAAKDYPACARMLKQIPQIAAEGNQPGVSKETAAELKPIVAWVRQEDELEAAKQEALRGQRQLIEALDADAPETQLESIHQKLQAGSQPIPAELQERYVKALGRRRGRAIRTYALIVVGVLAVVGLAFYVISMMWQNNAASGWAAKIHTAVADHKIDYARQVVQEQEKRAPQFNTNPQVAAAKRELDTLVQNQARDLADLNEKLKGLAEHQQAAEVALKDANADIPTLLIDSSAAQQAALEGAQVVNNDNHLAWVDPDHKLAAAVQSLQNDASSLKDAAQNKARAQAAALSQRLDGLALAMAGKGMDQAIKELDDISQQVAQLRQINGLPNDTINGLADLSSKISEKRTSLAHDMEMASKLVDLRNQATSPDNWKKALQAFVTAYPNAPQSADFARAAALTDNFAPIDAFNAVKATWGDNPDVKTEAAARERVDKIKEYVGKFARSPFLPALTTYSAYLQQAADALAVKGSWLASFQQILSSPLITDLRSLSSTDGRKFYVMGDIDARTMRFDNTMRISFKVIDPSDLTKRKSVSLIPPVTLADTAPTTLPHTFYAQNLATRLKQVGPENWDSFGITLIDDLKHDQKMDPVVRAIFLNQALKSTLQITGWGLADVYGPAARDLARLDVENIIWYDTANPVPATTLDAIKQVFDGLPKPEVAYKALKDAKAKIFAGVDYKFPAVGVLVRDEKGQWTIYTNSTSLDSGTTAWTVPPLPADEAQPATLLKVAEWKDGKLAVDDAATRDLPLGTMVYLKKP